MAIIGNAEYDQIVAGQVSLGAKIKGFFWHIWMMCFHKHDIAWYRYTAAVKEFEKIHAARQKK